MRVQRLECDHNNSKLTSWSQRMAAGPLDIEPTNVTFFAGMIGERMGATMLPIKYIPSQLRYPPSYTQHSYANAGDDAYLRK